jgi:hypothetical protein
MNYLASPVAYVAGTMDQWTSPRGLGTDHPFILLADIWPTPLEEVAGRWLHRFSSRRAHRHKGDGRWRSLPTWLVTLRARAPDSTTICPEAS